MFNNTWYGNYDSHYKDELKGHFQYWYDIEGISTDNEYVPFNCIRMNRGVYDGKVVKYGMLKVENYYPLKGYAKFYNVLYTSTISKSFKTKSMSYSLYGDKGRMYEVLPNNKVNILLLAVIKTSYIRKCSKALNDYKDLDKSQLAIMMKTDFALNPYYSTIYRKFMKEFIEPEMKKGIELIICNNIEDKCYKRGVDTPVFKTIQDRNEFLNSFNQMIT